MKNITTIIKYIFLVTIFISTSKLTAQTSGYVNTDSLIQSLKEMGIPTTYGVLIKIIPGKIFMFFYRKQK